MKLKDGIMALLVMGFIIGAMLSVSLFESMI